MLQRHNSPASLKYGAALDLLAKTAAAVVT